MVLLETLCQNPVVTAANPYVGLDVQKYEVLDLNDRRLWIYKFPWINTEETHDLCIKTVGIIEYHILMIGWSKFL